ncbi:MAG TPA: aminotransferase class I/II-fold pyridoxal phosphate-dependent enzyme [Gemmatimonadaceae bacterium]|jgi:histidinol-phosphate aminotransferase
MPLSRRNFLATAAAGSAGVAILPMISARGREALSAQQPVSPMAQRRLDRAMASAPGMIRIDSNENPNGPGNRAFEAMRATFPDANRYPVTLEDDLTNEIARYLSVKPENIMLGCGSSEVLRSAVQAFTSPTRALVSPSPSFELAADYARFAGIPVKSPRCDAKLRTDLDAMVDAAKGSGLVYFCNPNNPTATVHGKAAVAGMVERIGRTSPQTMVLIDEAYHEYVEDPAYATAIPMALESPNVFVARTFSKVFGMAGMRVGYAVGRPETIARMKGWMLGSNVNQLALAAAKTTVADSTRIADEKRKNHEAKIFTVKAFASMGYEVTPSDANFMMVDIKRDVKTFKAECIKRGVAVGRPFPPLNTHLRVSVGTMAEMEKAVEVFRTTLAG